MKFGILKKKSQTARFQKLWYLQKSFKIWRFLGLDILKIFRILQISVDRQDSRFYNFCFHILKNISDINLDHPENLLRCGEYDRYYADFDAAFSVVLYYK